MARIISYKDIEYDVDNHLFVVRYKNTRIPIDVLDVMNAIHRGSSGSIVLGYTVTYLIGHDFHIDVHVPTPHSLKLSASASEFMRVTPYPLARCVRERIISLKNIAFEKLGYVIDRILEALPMGKAIVTLDRCRVDIPYESVSSAVCEEDEVCRVLVRSIFLRRSTEATLMAIDTINDLLEPNGLLLKYIAPSPGEYLVAIAPKEVEPILHNLIMREIHNYTRRDIVLLSLLASKLGFVYEELDEYTLSEMATKIKNVVYTALQRVGLSARQPQTIQPAFG